MFLINSSVGSFAAAPTSLDTKVTRSKEQNHVLLLISEKIFGHKRIFRLNVPKNESVLMRDRYISRFNLVSITQLSLLSERGSYPPKWGQTLSRSYGRCIAEFLSEGSLVSLSLLDSSTCVGLRYGRL